MVVFFVSVQLDIDEQGVSDQIVTILILLTINSWLYIIYMYLLLAHKWGFEHNTDESQSP